MKHANIASVRDLDSVADTAAPARQAGRVERMTTHLRRYPAISAEERSQLLDFLTAGVPEEIVQVIHAPGLAPRYAAFRKDHPQHFHSNLRVWLPLVILVALAVIGLAWRIVT